MGGTPEGVRSLGEVGGWTVVMVHRGTRRSKLVNRALRLCSLIYVDSIGLFLKFRVMALAKWQNEDIQKPLIHKSDGNIGKNDQNQLSQTSGNSPKTCNEECLFKKNS